MNLITDRWLPTNAGLLTPAETILDARQPAWGRGDWDVSTRVFLIALLQSALIHDPSLCPDEETWEDLFEAPANVEQWFSQFASAFEDRTFEDFSGFNDGKTVTIAALLPEAPGESTVTKKSSDIAQWKEASESGLTEAEARIALYSDSLWGMRWGRGHRQGIRGESRMTTLVEPEEGGTLWQQLWLNVLPNDRWTGRFGEAPWRDAVIFPWLAPHKASVTVNDAHPLTVYWAMPRRVRLGDVDQGQIREFSRVQGGTEYVGWRHPLTPYVTTKGGEVIALRLSPGHLGYDAWAGITLMERDNVFPAMVVSEFVERRGLHVGETLRVRCCGWSLGSAGEAAAWLEQTVPLLVGANPEIVEELLSLAEQQRKKLTRALKVLPTSSGVYSSQLYARTETHFFERVQSKQTDGWEREIKKVARAIFDEATDSHRCDPLAVAKARARL